MKGRLIVHATNIHQGGGSVLLTSVLNSLAKSDSILSLDSRMQLPENMAKEVQIKRVQPTLIHRFLAEIWLVNNVTSKDVVLCFGNLPPLFKLRGRVVVFVQNRYLIDDAKLDAFPLKARLRLSLERLWLSVNFVHAQDIFVQTPSMKSLLEIRTEGRVPVRVLPFIAEQGCYTRKIQPVETRQGKSFDIIYVASGEPHKNHRRLIEAWCLLAKDGVYPHLKLTLDRLHFAELCSWIEQKITQFQLNVENLGSIPQARVIQLYKQVGALIYPSTFESFGLPLLEARQAGLTILASELDFVRDVLDPEQSFDPESSVSMARAVKRFLGVDEQPLPIQDATQFIAAVLKMAG